MKILLLLLLAVPSEAFTRKRAEPLPSPTPIVSPSPTATPSPSSLGDLISPSSIIGPSVDKKLAASAIAFLNKIYKNGCLKEKFMKRKLTSLHNIDGKQVLTKEEAFNRYIAGAPYILDLRYYSSSWFNRTVVGYTYPYKENAESGASETRIFTNSYAFAYLSGEEYGAHLAHELSHQARAGGFVHWTVHEGSYPYEIGNAAEDCI